MHSISRLLTSISKDLLAHHETSRGLGVRGRCSRADRRPVRCAVVATPPPVNHDNFNSEHVQLRPPPRPRFARSHSPFGPAKQRRQQGAEKVDAYKHKKINFRLIDAPSLVDLLRVIRAERRQFNTVNAVTALHRIAKFATQRKRSRKLRDHPTVALAVDSVLRHRNNWDGLSCSNLAWASAILGLPAPRLLAEVVKRLPSVVKDIGPLEIGIVLWACVKAKWNPQELFQQLAPTLVEGIQRQGGRIPERTLCRIPWAYASFDEYDASLFRTFAAAARVCIDDQTTPQGLSLLLWSYGKAIPPASESAVLLELIASQVLRRSGEFNWQDLANISWAGARISMAQSQTGFNSFFLPTEENYAPVTGHTANLFRCISERVQELLSDDISKMQFRDTQSIANIAWAFATVSIRDNALFSALSAQARRLLPSFAPQAIATLVWACARSGYQDEALFDEAAVLICRQLEDGADWDCGAIASALYSYAVLDHVHSKPCSYMFAALAQAAEEQHTVFTHSAVVAALWGCTVAQQLPQTLLDRLWGRAVAQQDDFSTTELHQLAQVHIALRLQGRTAKCCDFTDTLTALQQLFDLGRLHYRADRCWLQTLQMGQRQNVMAEFRQLKLPWVMEFVASEYSLDIAWPEQMLGIEVDGPFHFTANTLQPLGPTLLKRRVMQQAGWTLVSIPSHEWQQLVGRSKKQAYIAKKLEAAGWSMAALRHAMRSSPPVSVLRLQPQQTPQPPRRVAAKSEPAAAERGRSAALKAPKAAPEAPLSKSQRQGASSSTPADLRPKPVLRPATQAAESLHTATQAPADLGTAVNPADGHSAAAAADDAEGKAAAAGAIGFRHSHKDAAYPTFLLQTTGASLSQWLARQQRPQRQQPRVQLQSPEPQERRRQQQQDLAVGMQQQPQQPLPVEEPIQQQRSPAKQQRSIEQALSAKVVHKQGQALKPSLHSLQSQPAAVGQDSERQAVAAHVASQRPNNSAAEQLKQHASDSQTGNKSDAATVSVHAVAAAAAVAAVAAHIRAQGSKTTSGAAAAAAPSKELQHTASVQTENLQSDTLSLMLQRQRQQQPLPPAAHRQSVSTQRLQKEERQQQQQQSVEAAASLPSQHPLGAPAQARVQQRQDSEHAEDTAVPLHPSAAHRVAKLQHGQQHVAVHPKPQPQQQAAVNCLTPAQLDDVRVALSQQQQQQQQQHVQKPQQQQRQQHQPVAEAVNVSPQLQQQPMLLEAGENSSQSHPQLPQPAMRQQSEMQQPEPEKLETQQQQQQHPRLIARRPSLVLTPLPDDPVKLKAAKIRFQRGEINRLQLMHTGASKRLLWGRKSS